LRVTEWTKINGTQESKKFTWSLQKTKKHRDQANFLLSRVPFILCRSLVSNREFGVLIWHVKRALGVEFLEHFYNFLPFKKLGIF
jgi:hypothetical protein